MVKMEPLKFTCSQHLWLHSQTCWFNLFSPTCIIKFSQIEPKLFTEEVWGNFTLIIGSLLCLINSHFFITKCLVLYFVNQGNKNTVILKNKRFCWYRQNPDRIIRSDHWIGSPDWIIRSDHQIRSRKNHKKKT